MEESKQMNYLLKTFLQSKETNGLEGKVTQLILESGVQVENNLKILIESLINEKIGGNITEQYAEYIRSKLLDSGFTIVISTHIDFVNNQVKHNAKVFELKKEIDLSIPVLVK